HRRVDKGEIGGPVGPDRGRYANDVCLGLPYGAVDMQAAQGEAALDQGLDLGFGTGARTRLQIGNNALVDVHPEHFDPGIRKQCRGRQPDIAKADDSDRGNRRPFALSGPISLFHRDLSSKIRARNTATPRLIALPMFFSPDGLTAAAIASAA